MLRSGLDFEQVLAELARANAITNGNFQSVLRFLMKRTAEALGVRRVNVWLFDDARTKLSCLEGYDSVDDAYNNGIELHSADYPSYFSALEQLRTIAVMDTETDLRTLELRETYLRANQITTMLDAPIFLQGDVVGVICNEHTGAAREWNEQEKGFAGSVADFISLALETTRRIETEQRLSDAKNLFHTVAEQMSDGFALFEPKPETEEFIIRYVNPSAAAMYGYTAEEVIGKPSSIVRVQGAEVDLFKLMKLAEDRPPVIFEVLTKHKNGSLIPVEVCLNCVEYEGKKMVCLVGRNIAERRAAEEARLETERRLHEKAEMLQTITEQMSDSFFLLEPNQETGEFIFRYVNPSGARRYGYSQAEMLGKSSTFNLAPGVKSQLPGQMKRAKETGGSVVYEIQTMHRDGKILTIEVNFNIVRHEGKEMVAIIGRDISERKAAETRRMETQAKTLQAQRLESLGLLAGKIAHDFNNYLVGILGNVNLAMHKTQENEKVKRFLENIESTAQIAADLCNQLLIYSGKQQVELTDVSLSDLVREMTRLLEVSLPPNVEIKDDTNKDLPKIPAEPTQIRQVLLNLITNAADALIDRGGGEIRIKTDIRVFTEEELTRESFDVQAADFIAKVKNRRAVYIEVADNGVGMDAATRGRIFEPFFTTKAKGRGLGMTSLVGIVRSHSGAIKIHSELNNGTTVCVWFPAQNDIIS